MTAPRLPDVIETDRLVLRRRRVDDAAVFRELWTERGPRVPPHRRIGPDDRPTFVDIASAIRTERDDPTNEFLTIVRKHEGDVIGYCGLLFDGRGSPREPELAYELLRRAHGAGYATEAARVVVAHMTDTDCRRLWAGVREWNAVSRRVLFKLGFVETGQVEPDAEYGDSLVTVLTFADADGWA